MCNANSITIAFDEQRKSVAKVKVNVARGVSAARRRAWHSVSYNVCAYTYHMYACVGLLGKKMAVDVDRHISLGHVSLA